MVLSKRERLILIAAVVAVGALVANFLIINPAAERLRQTRDEKLKLEAEFNEAQSLFERQRLLEPRWQAMLADGLRSDADAESRVARALDEWADNSRLTLTSVKPDRVASDKGLQEMTFVVAGKGTLEAVAYFLWEIETAELPLKVKDMQLGSTSESGDTMSLQLGLSALYLATKQGTEERNTTPQKQQEADNEDALL